MADNSVETVALSKRQEVELEVAELKMLRFSLGVTKMDRIRNKFYRGTAHAGLFEDKLGEARLRWFGHVQRRDMGYIGRRMLRMEPPGRSKKGRPKRRFMDVLSEDMQGSCHKCNAAYLCLGRDNSLSLDKSARYLHNSKKERKKERKKGVGEEKYSPAHTEIERLTHHRNMFRENLTFLKSQEAQMICPKDLIVENLETKWKGSKARNIGGGFKLFYHGVDGKGNGKSVVEVKRVSDRVIVVEVKRVSDRVMIVKVEVEGVMINVISAYAPQVGCEKDRFWGELDEVVDGVPRNERLVIGTDFNGHVGEGNRGDEEVMGTYGFRERNVEGQMVVDFAKRMEMAVVTTYFKKKEDHRVTYKSGGRCTQVDYVLCRRCNLKEIGDCKVLAGESVAR
ncbi:hypothetical protein C0J50_15068 [Silurus asotus]|uniref:Craniofacial development protein 2-like n=1 Tax=Silurus asotus TaxID=30991 RepID=A0AAD5FQX6_SILAS|nr:hypothetical protein C0J50_15068 [Silurus asotus]